MRSVDREIVGQVLSSEITKEEIRHLGISRKAEQRFDVPHTEGICGAKDQFVREPDQGTPDEEGWR